MEGNGRDASAWFCQWEIIYSALQIMTGCLVHWFCSFSFLTSFCRRGCCSDCGLMGVWWGPASKTIGRNKGEDLESSSSQGLCMRKQRCCWTLPQAFCPAAAVNSPAPPLPLGVLLQGLLHPAATRQQERLPEEKFSWVTVTTAGTRFNFQSEECGIAASILPLQWVGPTLGTQCDGERVACMSGHPTQNTDLRELEIIQQIHRSQEKGAWDLQEQFSGRSLS